MLSGTSIYVVEDLQALRFRRYVQQNAKIQSFAGTVISSYYAIAWKIGRTNTWADTDDDSSLPQGHLCKLAAIPDPKLLDSEVDHSFSPMAHSSPLH